MKNQAIQYLAFDVHQTTVVAGVRDENGKVVLRATMATEAKVILAFVKNAGPRVHVVFEEGTQAQWLHDLLIDHVERVIVCNVRGRSDDKQECSHRCRCVVRATASRRAQAGLPWRPGDPHAQRAGALLHRAGRGLDAGDAAHQGYLPRASHPDSGRVGLPRLATETMAGQARGRRSRSSDVPAHATGHVARAAAEGEGGR